MFRLEYEIACCKVCYTLSYGTFTFHVLLILLLAVVGTGT